MKEPLKDGGFLVMRNDGLGARLMPLVNALRLGERTGIEVSMFWPVYLAGHNTAQYKTLFSASFCDEYLMAESRYKELRKRSQIRPETDIATMSSQQLRDAVGAGDIFLFENTEVDLYTTDEDFEEVRQQFPQALPDRFFTDEVAQQRAMIREQMADSNAVIYHIRHNDITRSYKTRATEFSNKYIPNEIYLSHMRENGIGPDRRAVLIGDCDEPLEWISARQPGAIRVNRMLDREQLSSLQYDFLELYTMSQANMIVAPEHSGFSKLAGRLGNVPVQDVKASLSPAALDDALTALETRLRVERESFTCDGDAAQAMVHLVKPGTENPYETLDALALREVESGSTVPFILQRAVEAAFRQGDHQKIAGIVEIAHNAMLPNPHALSSINAIAASCEMKNGHHRQSVRHLRRSLFLFPAIPQISSPLYDFMMSEDRSRKVGFYPSTINPTFFGSDPRAQRLYAQAFVWDNWPHISERFLALMTRGPGPKNLLGNLARIVRLRTRLGDTLGATLTQNLINLIQFYTTAENEEFFLALEKTASSFDPDETLLPLQRLAHAQIFRGLNGAARGNLAVMLRYAPMERSYLGLAGEIHFKEKQYGLALECFEAANPSGAEFLKFVPFQARLLDRSKRSERADMLMLDLAHESGWTANSVTQLCRRNLNQHARDELIDRLEPFAEFAGLYRPVYAQLGELYQRSGRDEDAVSAYLKAIELRLIPPILLRTAKDLAEKISHAELMKAVDAFEATG